MNGKIIQKIIKHMHLDIRTDQCIQVSNVRIDNITLFIKRRPKTVNHQDYHHVMVERLLEPPGTT